MRNIAIIPIYGASAQHDVVHLPHPRNGKIAPYLKIDHKLYEFLIAGSGNRCAFVGNNVVSNGQILISAEIHPIFVLLPFLLEKGNEFFLLDQYFDSATEYQPIEKLVRPYFGDFGEFSSFEDHKYWSFVESKVVDFLDKKLYLLIGYFKFLYPHKESVIHQKAFDALRHYLPSSFAAKYRNHLCGVYPNSFPPIILQYKPEKKAEEKATKETTKKKRIPRCLRNNKVITSFFKPQKIRT